jgi:hypothetical protein
MFNIMYTLHTRQDWRLYMYEILKQTKVKVCSKYKVQYVPSMLKYQEGY